jgi:hypothetical protein
MLEFIKKKDKCENLIVFVHGFIGNRMTWIKDNNTMPFIDLLLKDDEINSSFDIALFVYDTKLTELFPKIKILSNFIRKKRNKTNLPIQDISKLLTTELKYKCKTYQNIIFVGHSMGGLVTKQCIIDNLKGDNNLRIKMYVSLATPHSGSHLATYGKQIIKNYQVTDSAPLSETITKLTDDWIKIDGLPARFYGQGLNDQVVPKESSISFDTKKQEVIYSNDDHFSIIIPTNDEDIIVTALIQELKLFLTSEASKDLDNQDRFVDDGQFNNENFVLKLLIADIHETLVDSSKQAFFNAEYAVRKFSALGIDSRKLTPLYEKIKELYSIEFGKLLMGQYKKSTELVNAIHEKILSEDRNYLATIYPAIEGLHKYGMLHQLSNIDDKIWWAKEKNIQSLEEFKQKSLQK